MGFAVGNTQDNFNYKVVRQFALVTVLWGIVGMLVGVILAAQLIWPDITMNISWLSYGRLRPLHTNAVILPSVVALYSPRLTTSFSVPVRFVFSAIN